MKQKAPLSANVTGKGALFADKETDMSCFD